MADFLNLWEADPPAIGTLEKGTPAMNLWEREPGEKKKKTGAGRAVIPGKNKTEELRGPVSELVSALGKGVMSTGEMLGGTIEMLTPGPSVVGKTMREEYKRYGEAQALRRPEYLEQGDVVSDPGRLADWRWWTRSFGENLPNWAAMMIPGVGASRAAQGAAWGMKAITLFGQRLSAARIAGLGGAWAGSFSLEAGSAYGTAKDEMTRAGILDSDTIERVATLEGLTAGAVNSLIELLPFDNLFLKQAGADRLIKRMVRQTFLEGATEGTQEAVNILVEQLGHKPDMEWDKAAAGRILESALAGGMLGGFAGGTVGTAVHRGNIKQYEVLGETLGLTEQVVSLKDKGVPDKEIARYLDERIGELRGEIAPADEKKAAVAYALAGPGTKEVAEENKIPEIDAEEMVSYLLYATGRYQPAPDLYDRVAGAGKQALSLFGIGRKKGGKAAAGVQTETTAAGTKEETPETEIVQPVASSKAGAEIPAGEGEAVAGTASDALTPGPVAGKDAATEKNAAVAETERKNAENRKKGEDLFAAALSDVNKENQERLEARLQEETNRKAEEDIRLAAETEAKSAQAVAAAANEAQDLSAALAGDDPKKQALVAEVLGLSDRVLAGTVRTELGLDVQPAGQDRYEIITGTGTDLKSVPVTMPVLRRTLAEKRIRDLDAVTATQAKDAEAVRRRTEEAKAKREKETADWALKNARETLRMGQTLTRPQYDQLQAARDQLEPREIEMLDAGPTVAAAEIPRSLQALGVRPKTAAVESKAEETGQAPAGTGEQPSTRTARVEAPVDLAGEEDRAAEDHEDRARGYLHDLLADTIDAASQSDTGWVETEEGGQRVAAGGWISAVVKTFGRTSTTPLRDAKGNPQTLNLSKKYLANVIDKTRAGEDLTDQQDAVYREILREAKDEEAHAYTLAEEETAALAEFNPEEFAAPPVKAEEKEKATPEAKAEVVPYSEHTPEEKAIINDYNKKMDSEEWVNAYENEEDVQHFTKEEGHSPLADELIRDLQKEGLEKDANILEIGSGQGRDGIYLAKKGHVVKGIDVSKKAVKIANDKAKGTEASFEVGDAENLYQFENESQDAVYSVAALHSTPIIKTFAEIFGVLKPGGLAKLFLYTRTKTGNKWISYWTPGEIKKYAEEAGFKIEKFREGHDTEPIKIPGLDGLVEQETHLVVTTLRKPSTRGTTEETEKQISASKQADTVAEYQAEAARLDLKFNGTAEYDGRKLAMFTPLSGRGKGGTFTVAAGKSVEEELARHRAKPWREEKPPAEEAKKAPAPSQGVAIAIGKKPPKKTSSHYLDEQINYGGEIRSRGSVMIEMQNQGMPQKQIDAYMMGAKSVTGEETIAQPTEQPQITSEGKAPAFVESSAGSVDFGEIPATVAEQISRTAATIRLTPDKLQYIEKNHLDQIRSVGYANVADFIKDVAANYSEIREGKNNTLLLTKAGKKKRITFIELRPDKEGNYYTVNNAYPARPGYVENKKLLWQSAQTSSARQAEPSLKRQEESSKGIKPEVPGEVKQKVPEQDASYLKAVESGDMETAQKMVDEAALAAGYNVGPVFHGTAAKPFQVMSTPAYFTDSQRLAEDYARDAEDNAYFANEKARIVRVFLKMDNPLRVDASEGDFDVGYHDKLLHQASGDGHDGLILENVRDNIIVGDQERATTYTPVSPSQIKLADPMTYDDKGNIIPLSERFNEGKTDIRYALGEKESLDKKEIADLVRGLAKAIGGITAETRDGEIFLKTKDGQECRILGVDRIDADTVVVKADYGKAAAGRAAVGSFTPEEGGKTAEIRLVRGKSGAWTINHEFYHWLEALGLISNPDKHLLDRKIASLIRKDPATHGRLIDLSAKERRATWTGHALDGYFDATTPTGKIIQKIKDVIDQILNALGIRTAGGVIRDIRTGKIQERGGIPGTRRTAAESYAAQGGPTVRARSVTEGEGGVQRIVYENANGAQVGTARLLGSTIGDIAVSKQSRLQGYGREILEDLRRRGGRSAFAGSDAGKALMRSAGMEEEAPGHFAWPEGKQYAMGETAEEAMGKAREAAGRAGSRALGLLGARVSPAAREAAGAFAQHWKEFWRPFSTVPEGDKILARRYEAMGNVAKAVRFVQGVFEKLDAYPDQVKKDMFWYLNGDIPLEVLPVDARETAEMIRRRFDTIGQMLVDRGILAQGQYDKYKGRYIHYLYAKHILGDKFTDAFLTSTGKLNLTYARSRKDLTLQQRKELGLIEDASVAVPVGMGKALTDIAKADYLEKIAENADWVWQPSLVKVPIGKPLATPIRGRTRRNVTMGIGKLVEEVKVYDRMMETNPAPDVVEIHRLLREALDKAETASANMPGDFVQLPTSKGYGALAGAYVRKPIADDLMPILDVATDRGKLFNALLEIERQGMATFKMGKVALNFPTAVRNIVSNIIQMNMRGRALAKIPDDIVRACEELKAKGEYYEEAFGMGLFHTNWFVSEINDVLDEFRKVKAGRIDQLLIAVKNVAKYYGRIDDISKLAIFILQRKTGKSVDEATLEAMKWGMDYSLTSRSIKGLRQTIMPFACVDEETEILTKRGWLRHTDLTENDIALSLDLKDSLLKWQFINDIYRAPYAGDLLHFKDRNLDMMLTPDHKCIVYESKQKNFIKRKEYNLKYAHSLNTHSKIPVAGQYDQFPVQSRISDAMVQIIGWVVTEGHYKKDTAQVCISQNEGQNFDKIKKALDQEFPDGYLIQRTRKNQMIFHIHATPARHIRYYIPDKQLTAEFILALTKTQLELLIETMIDGDGSRSHKQKWVFIQKKNQTLDMFQMALVLSGISHGYSHHGNCRVITYRQKKHYNLTRTKPEKVHYAGMIWCPAIPGTGTWVARRNGRVFLTGNTYQYKIAPLILESLQKRPWVLGKYALIYTLAKAAAMALHDLDDDDWTDLEKQLPAYIKKSGSMMILPWKTDKGQWQWVNLEYYFPWGNYLAIARDMKAADLGEGIRDLGVSNPFLSMFYTGLSAREDQAPLHAYFGTPIYNQLDPGWMKAAKTIEYMGNTWMPSMATRQGAIGYTARAIAGGEDRWGREVTAGQALGRWFGFNIVSVSPEQTRAQASVRIQDLRKEQARIEANPSYTEEEKKAYAARLNEQLAEIAQEAPAAVLPITKDKGKDPVYEALSEMAAKGSLHTGPPTRSVEIAGIPLKMTSEQYGRYLDRSSEIARRKLLPLMESATWETMSDGRKAETVAKIVAAARKSARQRIKAEVGKENREKILEARSARR